jgi:dTDP-4-amino-4,6-dideoxygalactose transaminase
MIYYPVPAHKQKMFSAFGGGSHELPVTDWLTERVISLAYSHRTGRRTTKLYNE